MPLIVFDIRGIPATRRERIVAAVEAGGTDLKDSYEAWITSDPFGGGVRVLITGPLGFERAVLFALDEDSFEITEQVRGHWRSECAPSAHLRISTGAIQARRGLSEKQPEPKISYLQEIALECNVTMLVRFPLALPIFHRLTAKE